MTDEMRAFVVQCLACFDTPATVVASVKREFGLSVTPQAVEAYDPTKRAGRKLSERWRLLFEATREAFLTSTATIGISHKAVRLRILNRMAANAEDMGNMSLAAQLLEQAAKECGDAFTNRRELTGRGGKDFPASPVRIELIALTAQDEGMG